MDNQLIDKSEQVTTGMDNELDTDNGLRKKADDKSQQDADEQLPEEYKSASHENPENVDDMVQGKHLEKKYRGGNVSDVDEFTENKE